MPKIPVQPYYYQRQPDRIDIWLGKMIIIQMGVYVVLLLALIFIYPFCPLCQK